MKRGSGTHHWLAMSLDAFSSRRFRMVSFVFAAALMSSGCDTADKDVSASCSGVLLTAPSSTNDGGSFTVAELMAHSSAMGMTQREAETLIYLEGLSASSTLKNGQTLCVDGKPDQF